MSQNKSVPHWLSAVQLAPTARLFSAAHLLSLQEVEVHWVAPLHVAPSARSLQKYFGDNSDGKRPEPLLQHMFSVLPKPQARLDWQEPVNVHFWPTAGRS
jgi:hypothetical protein